MDTGNHITSRVWLRTSKEGLEFFGTKKEKICIFLKCITISYTKIIVELINIWHSYHGCYENVVFAKGKMTAMGDAIFPNLYFQNFLFFFPVRALITKVQSNKKGISIKTANKVRFLLLWQLRFLPHNEIKTIRAVEQI